MKLIKRTKDKVTKNSKKKISIKHILQNNKKLVLGILIGTILSGGTVYGATILYDSEAVSYNNTTSNLTSTNVQAALDELYSKTPEGMVNPVLIEFRTNNASLFNNLSKQYIVAPLDVKKSGYEYYYVLTANQRFDVSSACWYYLGCSSEPSWNSTRNQYSCTVNQTNITANKFYLSYDSACMDIIGDYSGGTKYGNFKCKLVTGTITLNSSCSAATNSSQTYIYVHPTMHHQGYSAFIWKEAGTTFGTLPPTSYSSYVWKPFNSSSSTPGITTSSTVPSSSTIYCDVYSGSAAGSINVC